VGRERLGETTLLRGKVAVEEETRARGFHGALVTSNGASIHPARYLAGIARAAIANGAELHERVAVTHVAPRSAGGFTVTASGNAILAKDVLVASNG
jgi:glycine/D-amino acid oxidase-like deaminating enzyme